MEYNTQNIEETARKKWAEQEVYKTRMDAEKPKFYVLDMFPYPSGAGLHVGHPLGYIASDVFARYKKHNGFNVLHPMGYDAFGLPAEQYAIQTGQHPAVTTETNLKRYREQLDRIGFSFDWSREIQTCKPDYYKWTQWIFLQLFNSWYNKTTKKAEGIDSLIAAFEAKGNTEVSAHHACEITFSAEEWKAFNESEKSEILLDYRIAFRSDSMVNWCPALGTVLANDEVVNGVSERGGHPVEQRKMMQWSLRISAYADRLLEGLNRIEWSDSIKEIQRNWIGKSRGAQVFFELDQHDEQIEVFTTRPDTIFGVSFMVLAPEHELVQKICTDAQRTEVEEYIAVSSKKTERDRLANTKNISGAFTGAYAKHPFTGKLIPIWIGDYVLASYGTGAVMAVPCGDQRDWSFAKHFGIEIPNVIEGANIDEAAAEDKGATLVNSAFLDGMKSKKAIQKTIEILEEKGIGSGKTNFKLRDAVFGRQRFWGEPIPIYFENGVAKAVKEEHLPLELPEVDKYLPTEDGEPPLARANTWCYDPNKGVVSKGEGFPLETTTMPGWAGSSWYFMRYTDPKNSEVFAGKKALDYWNQVDLYMGGAEHATGHLLYVRFWTKFLNDLGFISFDEPAKKLINQGMIQGDSRFVYRIKDSNTFVSKNLRKEHSTDRLHVDVNIVSGEELDLAAFKSWRSEFADAEFILEDGKYICGSEVEKMSKSKFNVVNPDILVEEYGADALRLHEMFLGPIEMHKPWNTQGISGVNGFLKKLWRLYFKEDQLTISEDKASKEENKALHTAIKKVREDIERYSFNTPVSTFMICVNELSDLKCNKKEILEPLAVLIAPYAPHTAEVLWTALGHDHSIVNVPYPELNESYLVEDNFEYPVSFNGKMRFKVKYSASSTKEDIEKAILADERTKKYLDGKAPKKVIIVPKRIINVVC